MLKTALASIVVHFLFTRGPKGKKVQLVIAVFSRDLQQGQRMCVGSKVIDALVHEHAQTANICGVHAKAGEVQLG
jgi:hypothetical protein